MWAMQLQNHYVGSVVLRLLSVRRNFNIKGINVSVRRLKALVDEKRSVC